ncbi:MAG: flagellar assembly protein FliW [Acidobacteriia bacterium]|nr:flagellar assembly protein FliW [Terriglobia bacterium]
MPLLETKYFGSMVYAEASVFDFPAGLPSFEDQTRFVFIETPEQAPLVFLQSLSQPELCFLALPILVVDRDYRLAVAPEDLAALELDPERPPQLGTEVLVLALVSLHDGFSATANLMAPIVVNLKTRRALQAIRRDASYSHEHPIDAVRTTQEYEGIC